VARKLTGSWRNSSDDPEEFRATLVEHLQELRDRVVRSVIALVIGWAIGWFFWERIYHVLDDRISPGIIKNLPKGSEYKIAFTNVTEAFMLQLKLSLLIGLILSVPFIVLQVWGFVAPGLKPEERKPFVRLAPYTVVLFATGVSFCWFILPYAFAWFTDYLKNYPGAALFQDPATVIFFSLKLMLAFGVGFQLPLVVWVLGALNILSAETLIKYWRQGATGIFIFAAVVTPSNDWFSMLMMAIPLTILFIISVYMVKFTQRKQKKAREAKEKAENSDEQ
jgi:sec-independent protein translocase protein TatC